MHSLHFLICPLCPFFLSIVLSFASVNGQFGQHVQYFPQSVTGGGATTSFAIFNPTEEIVRGGIEVRRDNGTLTLSKEVEVLPHGTNTVHLRDPQQQVSVGWAMLESKGSLRQLNFSGSR